MATTKKITAPQTFGVNINGIDKIVNAINEYQTAMKKYIDLSLTTKQVQAAIKGTNAEAEYMSYARIIERDMEMLLTGLDSLKTALNTVKANYKKEDSTHGAIKTLGDISVEETLKI